MNQTDTQTGTGKHHTGRILLFTLLVVLEAQISITLFLSSFRLSVGVVILSTLFFLIDDFPLLPVTFWSGFGVFLTRCLQTGLTSGDWTGVVSDHFSEWIFYLVYGLLLFLFFPAEKKSHLTFPSCLLLIPVDYGANLTELFIHLRTGVFSADVQTGILLAACVRFLLILLIVTCIRLYGYSMVRRDTLSQYHRSMMMLSRLRGEQYWLQQNTERVENTMHEAYSLYRRLQDKGEDEELCAASLGIATDIHEVKKEYLMILRGMNEAMKEDEGQDGMYLADLLEMLRSAISMECADKGKKFLLETHLAHPFYTASPYDLISVFRNLFVNAAEAADGPEVRIQVSQREEADGRSTFFITDNGPGIAPEELESIFEPGYSTKIDYETGEVSRGLGLPLTKKLVEDRFGGAISVSSEPGRTTFAVTLTPDTQEDDDHAHLSA